MKRRITLETGKGELLLHVEPMKTIFNGHIRLMDRINSLIDCGLGHSKRHARDGTIDLFTILFGADGCRQLLDWYGGDHEAALGAVLPWYNDAIMPRLRKRYRRQNYSTKCANHN